MRPSKPSSTRALGTQGILTQIQLLTQKVERRKKRVRHEELLPLLHAIAHRFKGRPIDPRVEQAIRALQATEARVDPPTPPAFPREEIRKRHASNPAQNRPWGALRRFMGERSRPRS